MLMMVVAVRMVMLGVHDVQFQHICHVTRTEKGNSSRHILLGATFRI